MLGCSHRRTTFPITPPRDRAALVNMPKGTHVTCLDCGKEFGYNWKDMKMEIPTFMERLKGLFSAAQPKERFDVR